MGQFFEELKRRNVLRVAIAYLAFSWLLIQIVETLFPIFGLSNASIRLVVILLAIGSPLVLLFSWVYELTPEGLKLERNVEREVSMVRHTGKRLDRAIIVVLALALGYFAVDKFVLSAAREESIAISARLEGRSDALFQSYGDNSIAVMPFVNMSGDASNEYFSDGISEELLNLLAKIPELRVISRSSAFSFKGQNLEIPEIARRLNVSHVLEGSVRKSGNQVRITAQLIEGRSDTHLWSETYDRTLDDIFATQDEISAAVVEQLKLELLGDAIKSVETSGEAYSTYLQAAHLFKLNTAESINSAISLYERTLELDPDYAPAWIGLSGAFDRMATMQLMPMDTARRLVSEASNRAIELLPQSAAAYVNLAWLAANYDGDLTGAANYYQRALDVAPTDVTLLGDVSLFLKVLGRLDESITLAEIVVSRDPVNVVAYNNLGIGYRYAGRLDEAEDTFLTALTLNPVSGGLQYELGVTRLLQKDYTAAEAAFSKEPIIPFRQIGMAMSYHALGEVSASEDIINQLINSYGEELAYYIAQVMAFRLESDAAFKWLETALITGDTDLRNAINEPLLSSLHSDARWMAFLKKLGASPEVLAAIDFQIELPRNGDYP